MKNNCAKGQGKMALGKNKPCCYFCDINLPYILYSKLFNCSTPCHELEIIIVKVKTANRSMKILRVDLQKANKDNIENKIEGYPTVAVFIL